MKIFKFVITGGPCGGKTTALTRVKEYLEATGKTVLVIPETATELIDSGITVDNTGPFNFQRLIFRLQTDKEDIFDAAAGQISENTVIICDRGLIDGNAYISNQDFDSILAENNQTKESIISRYDAVFHLTSAANGAERFYTLKNNSARSENKSTAKNIDKKTAEAWKLHPAYTVIPCTERFEDKIKNLTDRIIEFIKSSEE